MKNVLILFLVFAISIKSYSQVSEPLEVRISKDENFRNLNLLIESTISSMPTVATFVSAFDTTMLMENGDSYLTQITGYPVEDVKSINSKIALYTKGLVENFPELKDLSSQELRTIAERAAENYDVIYGPRSEANGPCEDNCRSVGRASMAAGIIIGGVGCAGAGLWGSWACATAGFWLAAEQTLACFRACPQQ